MKKYTNTVGLVLACVVLVCGAHSASAGMKQSMKNTWSSITNSSFGQKVSSGWNKMIGKKPQTVEEKFGSDLKKVYGGAKKGVENAGQYVKNKTESAMNGVKKTANKLKDGFDKKSDQADEWFDKQANKYFNYY